MFLEDFRFNEWQANHLPPAWFITWVSWAHLSSRQVAKELGDVMATLDDLVAKESAVVAAVTSLAAKVSDLESQLAAAQGAAGTLTSDEQAKVDSTDAGLQSALDAANAALNPAPADPSTPAS